MILSIHSHAQRSMENTILKKDTLNQLQEVVIRGQSIEEKLQTSPFSVQVIDMKDLYHKTGDIGNILNHSAGVKVRSDGNMGSAVQINLGGLQGKAIRIFKDGIPIELYGHGFNISTIPTNMLERIEIYKGATPVSLSSDALGGAINLVTRNPTSGFAEVSYELASFNTHRSTVNLFTNSKAVPSMYLGLNSSYNYSDNSYRINAPFVEKETGKKYFKRVKRFHDATSSYYGELFTGLQGKKWADDIRLSLIFSDFRKDIQNDSEMGKVFGQAKSQEQNYSTVLSYKKELLDNKLAIQSSVNYSHFQTHLLDTAHVRYDWNGDIIMTEQITGEINKGGSNQRLRYDLISTRINASYRFDNKHLIELGELYYRQRRKGSDPLGAVSPEHRIDVLAIPAIYQKNIVALGTRSLWFDQRMESILAVKHYSGRTSGFTTDKFNFAWQANKSVNQWGYLSGVRWNGTQYLMKLSYEYATRLPDELEVFGDGILIKENLDLQPEKSHNVHLHIQYDYTNKIGKGMIASNLFYRNLRHAIFLQPDIPYSRYINFHQVEIKGLELEVGYNFNNYLDINFNATYQDIRRINEMEEFKIYEGSRVPNIPFLFGNVATTGYLHNLLKKGDRLSLQWNLNYVHRFYLTDIPKIQEPSLFGEATQVESSLIIPNDGRLGQWVQDVGIAYRPANHRFNISFECQNMGNTRSYDNFNVQKPGRSFHLKTAYQIF
ncbi:TonB-dependent receptor plug domain-containing protein [Sphingobacterium tabacisoli]|uniref:TonB-dependent receptor plug domain-containing protein n=2 Tax=Sphingobacterium tabacisoli TaxID=2044855 RepID=A0ABW5L9R1_9SPHI